MVITLQTLLELINTRKSKVLLIAEASIPEAQFRAFRKLMLSEFGEKGLEGQLQQLYTENRLDGKQGHERE